MSSIIFPPVEEADKDGLLGIGGELTVDNLLLAYSKGIFPWPWTDEYVAWFSPPMRGILLFDSVHISQSLKKVIKKGNFSLTFDSHFKEVMEYCKSASNRKGQHGTWITDSLVAGYIALHEAGFAHSVEVHKDGILVAGLYGVSIGNYFSGESMFHSVDNMSKVALCAAISLLTDHHIQWMDCQMVTTITSSFGAIELDRDRFLTKLQQVIQTKRISWPRGQIGNEILHRWTHSQSR